MKFEDFIENETFLSWVVFVGLGVVLGTSYIYQADPRPKVSLCMFYNLTSFPCPGCGLTRSFCAIAKGNIAESFYFHWLGPIFFLGVFIFWFTSLFAIFRIQKPFTSLKKISTNETFIKIFLAALGFHWLIRLTIVFFS